MYGASQLERHANTLADSHIVVSSPTRVLPLLKRLEQNMQGLTEAYDMILDDVDHGRDITPAAEWIVDNFHAVEMHGRQIRLDLPPDYFRELPKLGSGFLAGHPRILSIVWGYVAHSDFLLDPETLAAYIKAYESRTALTLGELWAVAITLRFLLIENLRRLADLIVASGNAREEADRVADHLLGRDGGGGRPVDEVIPRSQTYRPSRALAVRLRTRLVGQENEFAVDALAWLDERLLAQGLPGEQLVAEEQQSQAAASVTMGNIFTSLRMVSDIDWEDWVESVSLLEQELRTNPGYAGLDFLTRNMYRSAIEHLARRSRQSEIVVTRAALLRAHHGADELRRDVGFWLLDSGRRPFGRSIAYRRTAHERVVWGIKRLGAFGYGSVVTLLTAALLIGTLWLAGARPSDHPGGLILLAVLTGVALSDVAVAWINYAAMRLVPARNLPGLALRRGIPDHLRTLVVVPCLLSSEETVDELLRQLEVHHLANTQGGLQFGLLTDWTDSPTEHSPTDDALLQRARAGVERLNTDYDDRFVLMHRPRLFNASEGVWMGQERKRGKLNELNDLLLSRPTKGLAVMEGRLPGPFRYVVTLDSDTRLPRESVRRMVGKIAHPLNQARMDDGSGTVTRGYAILQPRVTPSLPMAEDSSVIQRVFSTPPGIDRYAFTVSDIYQDVFGEGSFAGKGIYDVAAVARAVEGKVPDNTLLSHDLLEGNYARSGLISDVEVVEDHPVSYEVVAARLHRWTRGDWQLLPWLLRRREGLSAVGMWKMLDNLRRSLSPIGVVGGAIAALALLSAWGAAVWLLVLAATFYVPQVAPVLIQFRWRREVTARSQVMALLGDLWQCVQSGSLRLILTGHQAWLLGDAIVRTLFRLIFSRRHLLQWTTAAASGSSAGSTVAHYYRLMAGGLVAPALALAVGVLRGPEVLAVAVPPALMWMLAPWVASRTSEPDRVASRAELTEKQRTELRLVARQTWQYFATFVCARENHLPPDNFQEDPAPVVANRTSPTNIGLYLLSTLSARSLGWISMSEAVDRVEATLSTVSRLKHYRGHLYNWVDTRTLEPLEPRFVSTVDSGNFVGHLMALAVALRTWRHELLNTAHPPSRGLQGVWDSVELMRRAGPVHADLDILDGTDTLSDEDWLRLRGVVAHMAHQAQHVRDTSDPVHDQWALATAATVESLHRDRELSQAGSTALAERLNALAAEADRVIDETRFGFLLDRRRHLMSVGLHVGSGELDKSCYDLLASEARLTSFVAIAKGDVATRHWFLLGRTVTSVAGQAALQSWSGSMFEYLMPRLVMRVPPGGLLDRTERLAVRGQISYAAERRVPWGISESAYNARDQAHTYQYSPFGVPRLGIVRGLFDDLVVSPYSTGLATMVDHDSALENYQDLTRLGALGHYGFYESLDYTPERVPDDLDRDYAVVGCYMAHHQGMTVVALHNTLCHGEMSAWFHGDPRVSASEHLLQERAPREVPVSRARHEAPSRRRARGVAPVTTDRWFSGAEALHPTVHHLSNGRLTLVLTPAGGSQVRWDSLAITRWHPDPTAEGAGTHLYLRDDRLDDVWSPTPLPILGESSQVEVRFADDRAVYVRRHGGFRTELVHLISPESDTAVRRLTIRNLHRRERRLTLISYAELVLAAENDDDAHPVFSKLFITTEFLPDREALVATRRRRNPTDPEVWVGHVLQAADEIRAGGVIAETDRSQFLGRGRTEREPAHLLTHIWPPGQTGHVLDPVFSLNQRIRVPAYSEVSVHLYTFVAGSRSELLTMIDRHRGSGVFERLSMLAWTQSQIELRDLGVTTKEAGQFQTLAGYVTFPTEILRIPSGAAARDAAPQSALWPLGVSGDLPIVVARVPSIEDLVVVRQLIRLHAFWRARGMVADLVIVNQEPTGYLQDLQRTLEALAQSVRSTGGSMACGNIYVVKEDQVAPHTMAALIASARVLLSTAVGDVASQLPLELPAREPAPRPVSPPVTFPLTGSQPLSFFNGFGGFSADGREYVTIVDGHQPTPAPWTNVVANSEFGFLATTDGIGSTWWRNSRDNQVTPWRNDPVSNAPSELIYVRDDRSGLVSTPTAAPFYTGRHRTWHGFGYSAYLHEAPHLRIDLVQFVAGEDPVKISWLKVTNTSTERRSITVTSYHDLVLGQSRHVTRHHLVTSIDHESGALVVENPWSTQFSDQSILIDLAGEQRSWTGDREEFLGLQGTTAAAAAVHRTEPLSGRVGARLDPCAALQLTVTLDPGETREFRVLLAAGRDVAAARTLIERHRSAPPLGTLENVREQWEGLLGAVQVRTPDPSFDLLMNGWLLYQSVACRMFARAGFYQASGAFGFRDQLQDSMAIVLVDPVLARHHLLSAAGRQFLEGDVQHWWLPADGSGVRTRISDDVVWLAFTTAHYVRVTGDLGVLDEQVPFLTGAELTPEQHESFFTPGVSEETQTLYAHCLQALGRAFRYGVHGLPLMGTGDWNDGMNRVGEQGAGESVWLGWFLHRTLTDFSALCRARGDTEFERRCVDEQARLLAALERHGWDGAWYRRGYFDDHTPLGSATRSECSIDAIAQSWAVLSGAARPERAESAMAEMEQRLIRPEDGIATLFTPPFDVSEPDPGYVRAYPPGIRENGGQYTHGALWSIFAYAALGREDRAGWLFAMINPVNHARTKEEAQTYRVEPYVVAADVYSVAPHVGRGGWTWYTGSSGWMYRAGLEAILGLHREGPSLRIAPCLPSEWTEAAVDYRFGKTMYRIRYEAVSGSPRRHHETLLDGTPLVDVARLPLVDDGADHDVVIRLALR